MESSLWYYIFRDVRFLTSGEKAMSKLKKVRDKFEAGQTVLSVVAIQDEILFVLTSSHEDGILRYHTHRYAPVGGEWYGEDVMWFHSEPMPPSDTMYPFLSQLTQFTKQFYPTKDDV